MFWIILGGIALVAMIILYAKWFDFSDSLDAVIGSITIIFSAISVALVLMIFEMILSEKVSPIKRTEYYEIEKISTDDTLNIKGGIHGGALYVVGSISGSGQTDYKVYRKLSDGNFKLERIPSNYSIIHYSDENPFVEVTSYTCPKMEVRFWGLTRCGDRHNDYVINVPNGSILNKIEL